MDKMLGVRLGKFYWPLRSSMRLGFWVAFYVLILTAWICLFVQNQGSLAAGTGALSNTFSNQLHTVLPWQKVFSMWALMVLAMMLPTLIPMLACLHDLTIYKVDRQVCLGAFTAAYVMIWVLFSLAAGSAQITLSSLGVIDAGGAFLHPGSTFLLLLFAGLYQFSSFKQACLKSCQVPMLYFMSNWRDGWRGAVHMGVRHGLICLGCCWVLMILGFIGGLMNLVWMGIATLLMALEKMPIIGEHLRSAAGITFLAMSFAYATYFLVKGGLAYGLAN